MRDQPVLEDVARSSSAYSISAEGRGSRLPRLPALDLFASGCRSTTSSLAVPEVHDVERRGPRPRRCPSGRESRTREFSQSSNASPQLGPLPLRGGPAIVCLRRVARPDLTRPSGRFLPVAEKDRGQRHGRRFSPRPADWPGPRRRHPSGRRARARRSGRLPRVVSAAQAAESGRCPPGRPRRSARCRGRWPCASGSRSMSSPAQQPASRLAAEPLETPSAPRPRPGPARTRRAKHRAS